MGPGVPPRLQLNKAAWLRVPTPQHAVPAGIFTGLLLHSLPPSETSCYNGPRPSQAHSPLLITNNPDPCKPITKLMGKTGNVSVCEGKSSPDVHRGYTRVRESLAGGTGRATLPVHRQALRQSVRNSRCKGGVGQSGGQVSLTEEAGSLSLQTFA